jgi:FixJ family two-component response regulator
MPTPAEMVYVIDDDESIRTSLTWLLEAVEIPVQGYASADAFLRSREEEGVGVLILDVRMPGMSGMQLLEQLVRQGSPLQIIILTGHGDVPLAVRAMSHGAFYFIQKPVNGPQLVTKVRQAMARSRTVYLRRVKAGEVQARFERLTPREREVMNLIVSGHANKVIAAELGVVERTVEVHRHRVMEKMEADSVADLVMQQQLLQQQSD